MTHTLDRAAAAALLPARDEHAGKWSFGRALLLCGSVSMSGAALLAAQGALRSGAGLVQLGAVEPVISAARTAVPECLLLPLSTGDFGVIARGETWRILEQSKRASAVLYGCGVRVSDDGFSLLQSLLRQYEGTLVLDADGLNLLARRPELLHEAVSRCVLTPHWGEFCRLAGLSREELERDPAGAAMDFAHRLGAVLVLKGAQTLVTDGDQLWQLDAPNSGMAKGGSGDVLAGLTTGLCAQDLAPVEAAALAVWLHARAGALAREALGPYGMLPRDVLTHLPRAFLNLTQGE